MTSEPFARIVELADDAFEAILAINHATMVMDAGIPAPVMCQVLGDLKVATGSGLAQALSQLARGLESTLANYVVYQDDGTDPVQAVAQAVDALVGAASDAQRIGRKLNEAQSAIAGQGYRGGAIRS
ncbi:hypothetical protein [Microbacterium rhizosphaerae]|uniref:ESX-1 secretion-associated protein n=1 Tax=Microbacterium rhizosphaerae TaxID=1678237 RepID=A0ABZ0SML5_9MICO|nr:hypothetical protein [Microbacterium rhizosphaerae]WPR89730.1 hypothetical protein SM116_00125 [Microbacterium rhizosphaerae]